jgi:hypothetical protein
LHKRATGKGDKGEGEKERSKKKKQTSEQDETPAGSGDADEAKGEKNRERWRDPLNWFGLLPPASLRVAQTEFKSGKLREHLTLSYPLRGAD